MKILIVDDDLHVARLLAESISVQGHEAVLATTGVDALAVLSENAADAVFVGVSTPLLDGIEVLREIRARHPALPVVVLAGYVTKGQMEEAQRLGVTDVVEKPNVRMSLVEALGGFRDASGWAAS